MRAFELVVTRSADVPDCAFDQRDMDTKYVFCWRFQCLS